MAEKYRYDPLATGASRVLILHPTPRRSDAIHISLREFQPVEENISYEALSYVWGAATSDRAILCDGKSITVTPNCEIALRYLRRKQQPRILWVDAICIDQENDIERSHQVELMGEIYRQASCVVAWMGEAEPRTSAAFRFFRRCYAIPSGSITSVVWRKCMWMVYKAELFLKRLWYRVFPSQGDMSKLGKPTNYLVDFAANPYFRRIWTIQELAMGREPVVQCGESSITWKQLEAGQSGFLNHAGYAYLLQNSSGLPSKISAAAETIQAFHDHLWCKLLKSGAFEVPPISPGFPGEWDPLLYRLRKLVNAAHSHEASDERDRVYGLLGLFRGFGIHPPAAVYDESLSIESIYHDATRALIRDTKSLTIFDLIEPDKRDAKLSSWAHDFRYKTSVEINHYWKPAPGSQVNSRLMNKGKDSELHLEGIEFASILECGVRMPARGSETEIGKDPGAVARLLEHRLSLPRNWLELVLKHGVSPYPTANEDSTRDNSKTAFFKILFSFHLLGDSPAPLSMERAWMLYNEWSEILTWVLNHPSPYEFMEQSAQVQPDLRFFNATPECMLYAATLLDRSSKSHSNMLVFVPTLLVIHSDKRFFITENKYFGIGPGDLQAGDRIVIFAGATMPMVVRPYGENFQLVGPALVYGIMNGEAWPENHKDGVKMFTLV